MALFSFIPGDLLCTWSTLTSILFTCSLHLSFFTSYIFSFATLLYPAIASILMVQVTVSPFMTFRTTIVAPYRRIKMTLLFHVASDSTEITAGLLIVMFSWCMHLHWWFHMFHSIRVELCPRLQFVSEGHQEYTKSVLATTSIFQFIAARTPQHVWDSM